MKAPGGISGPDELTLPFDKNLPSSDSPAPHRTIPHCSAGEDWYEGIALDMISRSQQTCVSQALLHAIAHERKLLRPLTESLCSDDSPVLQSAIAALASSSHASASLRACIDALRAGKADARRIAKHFGRFPQQTPSPSLIQAACRRDVMEFMREAVDTANERHAQSLRTELLAKYNQDSDASRNTAQILSLLGPDASTIDVDCLPAIRMHGPVRAADIADGPIGDAMQAIVLQNEGGAFARKFAKFLRDPRVEMHYSMCGDSIVAFFGLLRFVNGMVEIDWANVNYRLPFHRLGIATLMTRPPGARMPHRSLPAAKPLVPP